MSILSFYEWQHICLYLETKDIMNIKLTCRELNNTLKPIDTTITRILCECIRDNNAETWQMKYAGKYIFRVKVYNFQLHNNYFAIAPFDICSIAIMRKNCKMFELILMTYNLLLNELFEFGWRKTPNWDIVQRQQKIIKRCISNNWIDGFNMLCMYFPERIYFFLVMAQDMCHLECCLCAQRYLLKN